MVKNIVYCFLCTSSVVSLLNQPANAIPLNPILDQVGRGMVERALGINNNSLYPLNISAGGSSNTYPSSYPPESSGQPVVIPQEQNPYNTYPQQPYYPQQTYSQPQQQYYPYQSYPQQPYYPQQTYPQPQQQYYPPQSYPQQPYYPQQTYPQPFIYNPTFVFPPNQSSPPVININNH